MRVALLVCGQARHPDVVEQHDRTVKKTFAHLNPDVYCAFWDEPAGYRALEIFQPKKGLLVKDNIQELRTDFWNRYVAIVGPSRAKQREKLWSGKVQRQRWPYREINRNNTLRQWALWKQVGLLMEGEYDYVIVTRPDIMLDRFPIKEPTPGKLIIKGDVKQVIAPNYTSIDHIFAGSQQNVMSFLTARMPEIVAVGETAGKKNQRPVSALRGTRWLSHELLMLYVIRSVGLDAEPIHFNTRVIRHA